MHLQTIDKGDCRIQMNFGLFFLRHLRKPMQDFFFPVKQYLYLGHCTTMGKGGSNPRRAKASKRMRNIMIIAKGRSIYARLPKARPMMKQRPRQMEFTRDKPLGHISTFLTIRLDSMRYAALTNHDLKSSKTQPLGQPRLEVNCQSGQPYAPRMRHASGKRLESQGNLPLR